MSNANYVRIGIVSIATALLLIKLDLPPHLSICTGIILHSAVLTIM